MKRFAVALPILVTACSGAQVGAGEQHNPGLTLPAPIASGRTGKPPLPARVDAGAEVTDAEPTPALPDPEPLRSQRQWEYTLRYDRGEVHIESVRPLAFASPVVTARRIGRFAIELWIGRELVDRARFDFPLVGADPPRDPKRRRRPLNEPPDMTAGVQSRRVVLVPASERATRAELVDRATGERTPLPWPPDAPLSSWDGH